MKGATTDCRLTPGIVAGLALVALIVHLLTIHRYSYFRDELYYIACARHLDFGYVDLAPLSAFLLRIELILFGSSLFASRIFPALASALTIVFTGILTRELGNRPLFFRHNLQPQTPIPACQRFCPQCVGGILEHNGGMAGGLLLNHAGSYSSVLRPQWRRSHT